jgi:hypothetical protein
MLSPLLFALAPAGAPILTPAEELGALDLVSSSALLVAHVADLPGLRQTAARNDFVRASIEPGGLLEAFAVPVPPIVPLLLSESIPAERLAELDPPFDSALKLVDSVRGDAVFFVELQEQTPVFGLAAYLGAGQSEFVDAANQLLTANGDTPFEELGNGFLHKVEKTTAETGLPTQHVAVGHGWMVLAGADEPLRCQALFERLTNQVAAGDAAAAGGVNPAFTEARKNLRVQGQFELLVDLAPLMQMGSGMGSMFLPPEVHEGLGMLGVWDMGWLGMRGGIGVGEQADWELAMNLPSGGGLARLADTLRPVPFDLLERVPADVVSVSASDVDVRGLIDGVLAIVGDFGDEYADMANGGLDQANAMVGFDVIDEFLGLIGGGNVAFKRPAALDQDDPGMAFLSAYMEATDLLVRLEDHEAFEDSLVELASFGSMMSEGAFELLDNEVGEQTLWSLEVPEEELPFDLPFRVSFTELDGRGVGAFSLDEAGLLQLIGAKPEKNVLSNPLLGPLLKGQSGLRGAISVVDTAAVMLSARTLLESIDALGQQMLGDMSTAEAEVTEEVMRALGSLDEEWIRSYFQGAMLSTLERTAGGIRVGFQMR